MNNVKRWRMLYAVLLCVLFFSCKKQAGSPSSATQGDGPKANMNAQRVAMLSRKAGNAITGSVTVFYEGLNNPRGLKFGPDGNLYVAEAGLGGSTLGNCTQVIFPIGPYTGSTTGGRISMITPDHVRTTVTEQFPSSQTNPITGGDRQGVADVAFVDNTLYALIAGGGCSHGVPSVPNQIAKVNANGSWSTVVDLSAWLNAHPDANKAVQDYEPDGTWYSMINVRGSLYALEPNNQQIVKVDPSTGAISQVIDLSKTFPGTTEWYGPTAIAYHGNFFIGNLDQFPIEGGASTVLKMTPDGTIKNWATGLNTILGLVFDNRDRIYVLEMTVPDTNTPPPYFPTPGRGQVVRIDPNGAQQTIATGLSLPTGMTMGPNGKLYVSNWGFGPTGLGGGQILEIEVK